MSALSWAVVTLRGGVFALLACVVACGAPRHQSDELASRIDSATRAPTDTGVGRTPPVVSPRIEALTPDSLRVGRYSNVEVLVRGSGFEPGAPGLNVVEIGPIRLGGIAANTSGTELRFIVPDRYSNSEAPPRPLFPGTYAVTVRTRAGASNAVPLRLLP